ncbi:MAG: hypothetical protein ACFFD4_12250 [Candidatus Odinarchaeota archaeon]
MAEAKFDEISRSSLMICLFSYLDDETMMLDNKPYLLGGSGFFKNKEARMSVETAYAQLNIPDLFGQFDFILNVANFAPYKLSEDLRLAPNIYTLKTKYENMFLMLLLLTPWADLNLTTLFEDVKEIIKDFSGSYRRVKTVLKASESKNESSSMDAIATTEEWKNKELNEGATLMLQRVYYKVFLERALIGGTEKTKKGTNLIAVLFQRGTVHSRYYCENCQIYHYDEEQGTLCKDCGGLLVNFPPVFTTEKLSIAFPSDLTEMERQEKKVHKPVDLFWLFLTSNLPDEISRVLYQVEPDIFQHILAVPNKSFFDYRDSDDVITLYTLWRDMGDKDVLLVTGVGDSTISGVDTLSSMAMRIFIRDLNEGIQKQLERKEIVKKSILKNWKVSKWVQLGGEATPEPLTSWENLEKELEEL